jgi:hypothetical protein
MMTDMAPTLRPGPSSANFLLVTLLLDGRLEPALTSPVPLPWPIVIASPVEES